MSNTKVNLSHILLWCALISSSVSFSLSSDTDMCSLVDSITSQSVFSISADGKSTEITTSRCRTDFGLSITNENINKRIKFEITFDTYPNNPNFSPLLANRINQMPNLVLTSSLTFKYYYYTFDLYGHAFNKRTINIVMTLDSNKFKIGDTLYYTLFKDTFNNLNTYDKSSVKFQYSASVVSSSDCKLPVDPDNGVCRNGKGICNPGFFDVDCSIQLPILNFDNLVSINLPAKRYSHIAIPIFNRTKIDIQLNVRVPGGNINTYVYYNYNEDFTLPSSFNYDDTYPTLQSGINSFKLTNQLQYVSYIVIGFMNENSSDQGIDISIPLSLITQLSATNILVILWIVFGMVGTFACIMSVAMIRRTRGNNQQNGQVAATSIKGLDIEKYFQKIVFNEKPSNFDQPTCSICLDDFEKTAICRTIIPCQHIFHAECIDSWLKTHSRCPNCNDVFDIQKIEKFISEKNKEKIEEKVELRAKEAQSYRMDIAIKIEKSNIPRVGDDEKLAIIDEKLAIDEKPKVEEKKIPMGPEEVRIDVKGQTNNNDATSPISLKETAPCTPLDIDAANSWTELKSSTPPDSATKFRDFDDPETPNNRKISETPCSIEDL